MLKWKTKNRYINKYGKEKIKWVAEMGRRRKGGRGEKRRRAGGGVKKPCATSIYKRNLHQLVRRNGRGSTQRAGPGGGAVMSAGLINRPAISNGMLSWSRSHREPPASAPLLCCCGGWGWGDHTYSVPIYLLLTIWKQPGFLLPLSGSLPRLSLKVKKKKKKIHLHMAKQGYCKI